MFSRDDCQFGYRDGLFKQQARRWLVLNVRLSLSRQPGALALYGGIRQALEQDGIAQPTPLDVSVTASARPNCPTTILGNAGSFPKPGR